MTAFIVARAGGIPPSITSPSTLTGGTQGSAYSYAMAATSGTPPYIWSLVSQTGTNSFAVSAAGVVSGPSTNVETDSLTIQVTDNNGMTATGVFSVSIAAAAPFQLATGHYVPAYAAPIIVHPRPDTETNSWERCRMAPNVGQWRIPISIYGGSWPFKYAITSNGGATGLSIGQTYGTTDYGVLSWTNPVIGTYSITVQVTTQDYGRLGGSADPSGQYNISFTLSVYDKNDTTRFVWLDSVNGNDANTGSYAAPIKTISKFASMSTAGMQAHFRQGTYTIAGILDLTSRAKVFVGYVGETATLDYTSPSVNANQYVDAHGPGCYFGNIFCTGSPSDLVAASNSNDYYMLRNTGDRFAAFENTFDSFDGHLAVPSNFSNWGGISMFSNALMHNYVAAVNNKFQNFTRMNSAGGMIWYSARYGCVEGNTVNGFNGTGSTGSTHGIIMKGRCSYVTMRNNQSPTSQTDITYAPFNQYNGTDGGGGNNPDQNELCWSFVTQAPPGNNGAQGSAMIIGAGAYAASTCWEYRNTVVGANFCDGPAVCTVYITNNVLCSEHGIANDRDHYAGNVLNEIISGNLVDTYANRASVVDPATGYVLTAYLGAHGITRGTVGHQVL